MFKRTLIVIGGTGFLGFHILKFFKKKIRIISVSRKKQLNLGLLKKGLSMFMQIFRN